jgi:aryl-alcohol dehydrogenase-like predicted oxidoreductase
MVERWERAVLGRTGREVGRIGLGASYGIGARDVERAFERGVDYFYWGSRRRRGFGEGIRNLARRHRERMTVVVQTYARARLAMAPSLEVALRRLKLEYADVLLLGWWDSPPPERILDGALALREAGKVRHIMVSCHHRPTFATLIADPVIDAIMVRYNAAHRGAETEVFPHLAQRDDPPGVVAYTATRWGALLDRRMVPDGEALPRASDCYRFALSSPHVDMCLAGPADAAQLDEALAALERGPMSDDELAWMRRVGDGVRSAAALTTARRAPAQLADRIGQRLSSLIR